jgi:hypothetical protein
LLASCNILTLATLTWCVAGCISGPIAIDSCAEFLRFCSPQVSDPDGEEPRRGLLVSVTQGNPGIVTCHDGE